MLASLPWTMRTAISPAPYLSSVQATRRSGTSSALLCSDIVPLLRLGLTVSGWRDHGTMRGRARGGGAMRLPMRHLAPSLALLVTVLVSAMDITVVSTVLPTIVGELGGLALYSWSFSAYLLTST